MALLPIIYTPLTFLPPYHSHIAFLSLLLHRSSEAATASAIAEGSAAREEASSALARLDEASKQLLALGEASETARSAMLSQSAGEVEAVRQQLGQVGGGRKHATNGSRIEN